MNQHSITKYYENNRFTFRYLWNSRQTQAIHFGYYDEKATKHEAALANMNRKLAELACISEHDRVLDAGCGIGGSAIWLAKELGCAVDGIVLVKSQAEEARQNIKKARLDDEITIYEGDYNHTPFEDGQFDVIWALESHCHTDQKAAFYKEAARLLKKGGRLVMADLFLYPPLSINDENKLKSGLTYWAIPNIDDINTHQMNATKAGFADLEIQNINSHVQRSLRNAYEHAQKWSSTARFLQKIGLINPEQVGNAAGTKLMFEAWLSGNWFYGLAKAVKI
jgi:tocopherol O-methyltransferase